MRIGSHGGRVAGNPAGIADERCNHQGAQRRRDSGDNEYRVKSGGVGDQSAYNWRRDQSGRPGQSADGYVGWLLGGRAQTPT